MQARTVHWKSGGHKEVCASQDDQLEAAMDPDEELLNKHAPKGFLDPISLEIMNDPVMCVDGNTYDRPSIEGWFNTGHSTSPLTGLELEMTSLFPNICKRKTGYQR
mmetsp:Transcript_95864/g.273334  ORF Transcript_95864/g.273334 Transcript_95864/m.273334 type:complete len:106 (+) Transcript_95864:129-446(+)